MDLLDDVIGLSRNLSKIAPLRIIAVGGFVSVNYLETREFTGELDFILAPTLKHHRKMLSKLKTAIKTVATELSLSPNWASDLVGRFAPGNGARKRLFFASLAQDERIYKGHNIEVYAAH
jgi:hypothetical protein